MRPATSTAPPSVAGRVVLSLLHPFNFFSSAAVWPSGGETLLHRFGGGFFGSSKDGKHPVASLLRDSAGNIYGTTRLGGAFGWGAVFKLYPSGLEIVLHSFTNGADGGQPFGNVIRDAEGNLHGTTAAGGAFKNGTVFKLDTTGKETVLHSFTGGYGGREPFAGLVRDAAGNLYGTTLGGSFGNGTVFKLEPTGVVDRAVQLP
jgi:uncharacterized repeat protein (TIGR03803 family)